MENTLTCVHAHIHTLTYTHNTHTYTKFVTTVLSAHNIAKTSSET